MKTFFKMFIFFVSTVIVLSFTKFENNPKSLNSQFSSSETMILSSRKMDGNNISAWYRNNGIFNRDFDSPVGGFEWPAGTGKTARYASGIWIGGRVGNDTLVAISRYESEYLPGYVDNNGNPQGKDDASYKIYNIVAGDTISFDYQNWPSKQGAYLDLNENPLPLGNQTLFFSYTDAYPDTHNVLGGNTAPLKSQILNTSWCYNLSNHLYNIIFTECRIINRNNQTWNDVYIGLWTDDDIGNANQNKVGCDSILNLTYTFYSENYDPIYYGIAPPAVGFQVLQGGQNFTGNLSDTAYIFNPVLSNKISKIGYKDLNLTSFTYFQGGDPSLSDPVRYNETYRTLQGFKRSGTLWINPITNQSTKYPFNGDPEIGSGWIMPYGYDVRSLSSIGPVTVHPNDTQYLIYAQIIAKGTSNLNSVTKLKEAALISKRVYDNNFINIVSVKDQNQNIPERFYLYQNFPNPFNPETKIRFDIKQISNVILKVYDVSGKLISTLVDNEILTPGTKQITFNATGLSSGVYFYTLETENFKETKRMILVR